MHQCELYFEVNTPLPLYELYVVKELNVQEALKSSILVVQKAAAVPLSWSFLNGLLNHVVKELNVEEVLKSPFFVVQKAAQRYSFFQITWIYFCSCSLH